MPVLNQPAKVRTTMEGGGTQRFGDMIIGVWGSKLKRVLVILQIILSCCNTNRHHVRREGIKMLGLLTRAIDPSLTFASACTGGCLRGMCPLRSWKISYFCNWNCAIWLILSGNNLEQVMSKKHSSLGLTDQNFVFWEKILIKFC